jgi:hypothetical protein
MSIWYEDMPVIGKLSPAQAAEKLREIGENETASTLERTASAVTYGKPGLWPFQDKAWQHTAHAFGYIAPSHAGNEPVPIKHAGNIPADTALKNARVNITLNHLRVAEYPGKGTHNILFDFYAQNQLLGNVEHLHFNAVYRVKEGERAAILGYPIFAGLNVGSQGMAFKCYTINVKNEDDEALLGFLESDVFKEGLKLVQTAQPAIAPLSAMAVAVTKSVAKRNRNVPVQEFHLGLDFTNIITGARLAQGSYLAVQIPETFERVWDWDDWVYHPAIGQVVNRDDPKKLIPYNYLIFSVSRYEGSQ